MMKKVLVLGLAVAIMLVGCGKNDNSTESTEIIETENEYFTSEKAEFVHYLYPAVEHIIGSEVRYQNVEYCDDGIIIDGILISYDLIDYHCTWCNEDGCR